MIHLPWELHDRILEYLSLPVADLYKPKFLKDPINRKALIAYSKASHPCCMRARGYLFSSMVLQINHNANPATATSAISSLRRFAAVLSDSLLFPGLGMVYHIRSFVVRISTQRYPIDNLLQEGAMAFILDTLHGPNHGVKLFGWEQLGPQFNYSTLTDNDFLRAFDSICHSRNLQHLLVRGLIMLPITVLNGASIKNLELYNSKINDASKPTIHNFHTSVESMGLDRRTNILELFQHGTGLHTARTILIPWGLPFQRLRDIHLPRLSFLRSFPKDIFNVANTLQSLKIQVVRGYSTGHDTLAYPLRLLNRLKVLHIYHHTVLDIQDPWIISPLCDFLELCSFPQSLKTLSLLTTSRQGIDLFNLNKYEPTHEETSPNRQQWTRLDSLLTQPELADVAQVKVTLEHKVQLRYTVPDGLESFDFKALSLRNRNRLLALLPELSRSRRNNPQPFLKVDLNVLHIERMDDTLSGRLQDQVILFGFGGKRVLEIPFYND